MFPKKVKRSQGRFRGSFAVGLGLGIARAAASDAIAKGDDHIGLSECPPTVGRRNRKDGIGDSECCALLQENGGAGGRRRGKQPRSPDLAAQAGESLEQAVSISVQRRLRGPWLRGRLGGCAATIASTRSLETNVRGEEDDGIVVFAPCRKRRL